MRDRFNRIALVIIILLFGAFVARPYLTPLMLAERAPRALTPRGSLAESEASTIALFENVAPSVVQVVVSRGQGFFGMGEPEGQASGTGFIWDAAGHVVTNNHVVEGAGRIVVRLASGEDLPATLVGRAPNYDLAVLRVTATHALPEPVPVGSSADLKVGQSTFAIGNPFGLDQTLTTGVVSALKRRLPTTTGREIADVVQTDAAINPGNSGGPLLDSSGRLIGVNTAIFSPSGTNAGVGFAIPVDTVNRVVPELIRNGRFPTPGIGILVAEDALAARMGVDGILIAETMQGSPAAGGGLQGGDPRRGQIGDVIVEANGKEVRRLADLMDQMEAVGVGKPITLVVERDGRRFSVDITIADIGRT